MLPKGCPETSNPPARLTPDTIHAVPQKRSLKQEGVGRKIPQGDPIPSLLRDHSQAFHSVPTPLRIPGKGSSQEGATSRLIFLTEFQQSHTLPLAATWPGSAAKRRLCVSLQGSRSLFQKIHLVSEGLGY